LPSRLRGKRLGEGEKGGRERFLRIEEEGIAPQKGKKRKTNIEGGGEKKKTVCQVCGACGS